MGRYLLHTGTDLYTHSAEHAAEHHNLHAAAFAFGYSGHVHSNRDNRPYRGAHVHTQRDGRPDFDTLSVAVPVPDTADV